MTTESSPPPAPAAEDRTVAILSYITALTLIGFILAIILHTSKPTRLGAFHLRQTLGLIILGIVVWISLVVLSIILAFIPVLGPALVTLLWFGTSIILLAAWVLGLIAAIQGKEEPLPVVGVQIQKMLENTFK